MDNLEFARQISELRKAKGLSQKELGELLGVSNKAVSKCLYNNNDIKRV